MNTAVRPIGNVRSPEPVESEIEGFPWICQMWIGSFIGGGRRLPESPQHESMQSKHAQAMIAGVAHKQIAGADRDAMGIFQLPRPAAAAAQTGNRLEAAFAGIEAFQLRGGRIEQIDTAVGA